MEQKRTRNEILNSLRILSNNLGDLRYNLAIIGEGNSSAKIDSKTFYVTASGSQLSSIKESGFVELSFNKIMGMMDMEYLRDSDIKKIFDEAKTDRNCRARPSVETLMHAICLSYEGINFVGHTHPTAILRLACSKSYPENLKGRIYPDEIVFLGYDSVFLSYTDPGIILAKAVKNGIDEYIANFNENPKVIYIQNHGMVALGSTAQEVENITLTANKAADVRLGALATGGIVTLSVDTVKHILGRPDEAYRQNLLV
jgi:rhamnose utilization protein RhaD (predicted bifunctional aldolase and dehydrogenase)